MYVGEAFKVYVTRLTMTHQSHNSSNSHMASDRDPTSAATLHCLDINYSVSSKVKGYNIS